MKLLISIWVLLMTIGCNNGANDGDPKTDTTNMPVDTSIGKDSTSHYNRADGPQPLDTNGQ